MYHIQGYQRRIVRAFNKKGEVEGPARKGYGGQRNQSSVFDLRGKFRPKWAGQYIIKTILFGGAASIIDLDGNEFSSLVNLDQIKCYYP